MGLLWRSALSGMAAVAVSCVVGLLTYLLLTLPLLDRDTSPANPGTTQRHGCYPGPPRLTGGSAGGAAPGVVRYSVTALVTYGLLAVMLSSDTLVAKHYLSSHQAGLYAGVSLAGKIAYFAASSLFVVAFPVFSRHHDQGTGSGKWILAAGGVVCATAGAIVIAFALEPAWVVVPLLGERYQAAEGYVPWMAAVFGLYALGFLVSIYLLARKRRSDHRRAGCRPGRAVRRVLLLPLDDDPDDERAGGRIRSAARRRDAPRPARRRPGWSHPRSSECFLPQLPPLAGLRPAATAGPASAANLVWPGQPVTWQAQIVSEVTRRVGSVPVLLAGSRALGTAHADSDYDVVAVLPLLRIPRAASRLAEASRQLSAALGRQVSVNPVPRFRMRRPGGSLFVRKLQAEAIVLAAPPGWSLHREPLTGVTKFAASSALLSAARSLLETFDTSAMRGGTVPAQADDALRKAALHVAQVRLLRSGQYASDLEAALSRLTTTPPSETGDTSGAELSAALTGVLPRATKSRASCAFDSAFSASWRRSARCRSACRPPRAWSATPSTPCWHGCGAGSAGAPRSDGLPSRPLWQRPSSRCSVHSIQTPWMASTPHSSASRVSHFRCCLGTRGRLSWEGVRDLALAEWLDAHPARGGHGMRISSARSVSPASGVALPSELLTWRA